MNAYRWGIGGLLAVAVVLLCLAVAGRRSKETVPEAETVAAEVGHRGADARQAARAVTRKETEAGKPEKNGLTPGGKKRAAPGHAEAAVRGTNEAGRAAADAAAERAVAAWDALVDQLTELKDAPTKERRASVKAAFDRLRPADQIAAVHQAVNLVPDEQFTSLFGILFDKTESPEVLDAIFSDGLNRPEEIKVPMMKTLVADKTHPMFFESARILDATGELEGMTGTEEEEEREDAGDGEN
jgi:hypothetical protein